VHGLRSLLLHVDVNAQLARMNLDLLFFASNGIMSELCRSAASQNCHSCQFAYKRMKGAVTAKVMFCA